SGSTSPSGRAWSNARAPSSSRACPRKNPDVRYVLPIGDIDVLLDRIVRHRQHACRYCKAERLGHRDTVSVYSSTEFARSRKDSGIASPMAFAVLRFMTSSNFVGCSIGMSFG